MQPALVVLGMRGCFMEGVLENSESSTESSNIPQVVVVVNIPQVVVVVNMHQVVVVVHYLAGTGCDWWREMGGKRTSEIWSLRTLKEIDSSGLEGVNCF